MTQNERKYANRTLVVGVGFGFIILFLVAWLTPASWTHDNHITSAFCLACALTFPLSVWLHKHDKKKADKEGVPYDGGLSYIGNWFWTILGAGGFIIMSHVMYLIENFV